MSESAAPEAGAVFARAVASKSVLARAASIAASAALSFVIARVLGPNDAGVFFVVFAVLIGAATIGRFGTDNLALKWVASGSSELRSKTRTLILIAAGFSFLATAPTFWAARFALEGHVPDDQLNLAAGLATVSLVPAALSVVAGAALRAMGRLALGIICELGSTPAVAVVAVLGLEVAHKTTLVGALGALAAGNLVSVGWSLPLALRQLGETPREGRGRRGLTTLKANSAQLGSMMSSSLLFYLLTWAPVLVLGIASDPREVAYFNIGARLAAFISLIPAIQSAYLTPQFARLHYEGRVDELNATVQRAIRQALVAGTVLVVPLLVAPRWLLGFFGPEFPDAANVLVVLALAALVVVGLGPVNGLLLTCGFEKFAGLLNAGTLLVAVALMFAISDSAGAFGVALVGAASSIVYATIAGLKMSRSAGIVAYASPLVPRARRSADPAAHQTADAGRTRVLFLAGAFARPGDDPWLLDDLASALARQGVDVHVVSYDPVKPRPLGRLVNPDGVVVDSVGPERSTSGPIRRPLAYGLAMIRLRRHLRVLKAEQAFDLCVYHTPGFLSGGLPRMLRRTGVVRRNVLILWDFFPVHHAQIGRVAWALQPLLKRIERRSFDAADVITVMSPLNGEFLRSYHRGVKAAVVELPPWGGSSVEHLVSEEKFQDFTVVFGGQLEAGRGVETLLEAARLLVDADVAARVLIVGEGRDRSRLERLASDIAGDRVRILGRVPRDEYLSLLRRVHAGVAITVPNVTVPSFPSKIVDYLRVGLPVVACLERTTDVGHLLERERVGVAVDAGDARALADALLGLAREHAQGESVERAGRAREFFERKLSSEAAAGVVLGLVQK